MNDQETKDKKRASELFIESVSILSEADEELRQVRMKLRKAVSVFPEAQQALNGGGHEQLKLFR